MITQKNKHNQTTTQTIIHQSNTMNPYRKPIQNHTTQLTILKHQSKHPSKTFLYHAKSVLVAAGLPMLCHTCTPCLEPKRCQLFCPVSGRTSPQYLWQEVSFGRKCFPLLLLYFSVSMKGHVNHDNTNHQTQSKRKQKSNINQIQ